MKQPSLFILLTLVASSSATEFVSNVAPGGESSTPLLEPQAEMELSPTYTEEVPVVPAEYEPTIYTVDEPVVMTPEAAATYTEAMQATTTTFQKAAFGEEVPVCPDGFFGPECEHVRMRRAWPRPPPLPPRH